MRLHENDKRYTKDKPFLEQEVHRVQILDPATGTGTFLAEVVKHIHQKFKGQQGIWNSYVEQDLLPRLNGFELLMASYAMAHLQLDLLLTETGYTPTPPSGAGGLQRLKVFLTNSLEEPQDAQFKLAMAQWLSDEGKEADKIKRETPVMCIIGNPPYSGESANKGEWIMKLMEDYKQEPDNKGKLKERNPKWINDDYVKFLRYGQYFIEKNGSGVLAFINPHGFLDNPTFRGMRYNLLQTYDKIYTIDLHGNSKKQEVSPDGSPDQNVFDIMQGVSINFFVKTGKKKEGELGKLLHFDLYGKREAKYDFLLKNTFKTVPYTELPNISPNYLFIPKNFDKLEEYNTGFDLQSIFPINSVGIVTANDNLYIAFDKQTLKKQILEKYEKVDDSIVRPIDYRLFDTRFLYNNVDLIERSRIKVMQHFLLGKNLGLALCKQVKTGDEYCHTFISSEIIESSYVSNKTSEITSTFPLYLYPDNSKQQIIGQTTQRQPNLNKEIVAQIAEGLGLTFTPEKETTEGTFAPIDLLDYIYAVLHSPTYREAYKEFLKIDFPRVPYPTEVGKFWELVRLGGELRQIHLLESEAVENYITQYPVSGANTVGKLKYEAGKVWINDTQYFEGVPQVAWDFYIGGYQPAQKWLKDRKDRALDFDDIFHYQKIIVALTETDRIMREIDVVGV
jgi:predicted helicase